MALIKDLGRAGTSIGLAWPECWRLFFEPSASDSWNGFEG